MSESPAAESSSPERPVVGILGAGRAGTAFARTLLAAGVDVDICSTRSPRALQHHLKIYAPGTAPVWPEEIAVRTRQVGPGIVILAIPQEELDDVDPQWVSGTVLVDATNTWQDELLPGWLEAAIAEQLPTSMAIAGHFGRARVVKALNHISHHDVDKEAQPDMPLSQRRAVAVAADDEEARGLVMGLLVRMGFDPVSVGALAAGRIMEPDGPLFNRPLRRDDILRYAR
ncbi:NADPH-dependent F420 reductase [Nesterenkonia flava]|uniref:NAD(P)-binding domain-containing protein n=1 Tax=Nesterenkonia flava TaxID=469799 RepID=A0ABU1FQV3_9MICC|nr:NAD(P)-binding domain-containing protein [Nesterenkonia flava]MDR5711016.1 NAD(P)-binding domain-containing protein [Nesterenkonia flava]